MFNLYMILGELACYFPLDTDQAICFERMRQEKVQSHPPSSVADATASPKGEAFYAVSLIRKISTFFENMVDTESFRQIALSNRLPLGGKLAR